MAPAETVGQTVEQEGGVVGARALPAQLLEYSENELYEVHTDCNNAANDRAGTSLIFLTDVEGGGETGFPALGISIKPKKGMGLLFGSKDKNGKCLGGKPTKNPCKCGGHDTVEGSKEAIKRKGDRMSMGKKVDTTKFSAEDE